MDILRRKIVWCKRTHRPETVCNKTACLVTAASPTRRWCAFYNSVTPEFSPRFIILLPDNQLNHFGHGSLEMEPAWMGLSYILWAVFLKTWHEHMSSTDQKNTSVFILNQILIVLLYLCINKDVLSQKSESLIDHLVKTTSRTFSLRLWEVFDHRKTITISNC